MEDQIDGNGERDVLLGSIEIIGKSGDGGDEDVGRDWGDCGSAYISREYGRGMKHAQTAVMLIRETMNHFVYLEKAE